MTTPRPPEVTGYELRVGGHLDRRWSAWFDGFTLTHEEDGTTTLRGSVRDQAELHGLLARIRDLGADLVSVTPLAGPVPRSHAADAGPCGKPR